MCARDELIKLFRQWIILIRHDGFHHVETGKTSKTLSTIPGPWVAIPDSDKDEDLVGKPGSSCGSAWQEFFNVQELRNGAGQQTRQ
jgi:hypothetical protein